MPNRLADETSPYLRQHAGNPVDWYPWGEEALARARAEGKPILLSIGYSACHWCHVMAHESFEDAETAAAMNRLFVNIKVDREERPDLDHIYQTAQQMLSGRAGGWPLTLFLTPEGLPFFGGTYFPKTPRHGLPGFVPLLERVAEVWSEQREVVVAQGESLRSALARTLPMPSGDLELDTRPIELALEHLEAEFDPRWGGFGEAPKFPHPVDLSLLLNSNDVRRQEMALLTLRRMAEGGLFDQLGGGFFRYSVDAQWGIPHFEKMLYDNGLLLGLYADAWALSADALFKKAVEMTAGWALREMQATGGGFYSALDADSGGEEGKYYVWRREEVRALLSEEEYQAVAAAYGLDAPANFENEFWHLRLMAPLPENGVIASARAKLLAAREGRVRPGCDDKILAAWNGLMIEGLLRAARRFDNSEWRVAGQRALDFVRSNLWRDGRLLATCREGRAHLNAYVDDYTFLLAACLESLQGAFRRDDLDFAVALADALLERFEDRQAGGFYFTSHDHEALVYRFKVGHDGATPAGNGVAALALQRLAAITGESRYADAAGRVLGLYYAELSERPLAAASLLMALTEWRQPAPLAVLRGPSEELPAWQRELSGWRPGGLAVIALENHVTGLPAALAKAFTPHVNAWICEGVKCLPPIDRLDALRRWFARR